MSALAEYAESIKEKNQTMDIGEFEMIKQQFTTGFMLKNMTKAKIKESAVTSGKAGQGIGAWNKTLNTLFCVWFRAAEKALLRSFNDHVIYANGFDDARFYQRARGMIQPDYQNFENDYTEYDSCQNEVTIKFECRLWSRLGVPKHIIDIWQEQRMNRTMNSPGLVRMPVMDKKDSGEPATLIGNTCTNMAVISQMIEIEDPTILAFKGDDSFVQARVIKEKTTCLNFIEKKIGFKTKVKYSQVPQFCAKFIHQDGFFIDIPSRALKLLTRTFFPDSEKPSKRVNEFREIQQAVFDWLECFRTQSDVHTAEQLAYEYYREEFDFTMEEIQQMTLFLYSFANPKMTYNKFRSYTIHDFSIILNVEKNE
nr:MAG: non-structural polyprotein [Avian associated hepe-like virus 19]